MAPYNYTPISESPLAPADAATFNAPFGTIDAAIGDLTGLSTSPKTSVAGAVGGTALGTTATTISGAIAEHETQINAIAGGATASDQQLKDWTSGECFELTAVTRDADGVPTTATVKWPDGGAGTFTTTTKDATWLAINAFTISHAASSKTVTQAAVTRDANGDVTTKPALTVA